jgi:serine/threonine protein kinase
VKALIGEGGAGQVFAAFDRVMKERVALKVLRPERPLAPSLRASR